MVRQAFACRPLAAAVVAMPFLLAATIGLAQAPAQPLTANVDALALQPIPAGASVEVVTYDDSDLARSIGEVAAQALRGQGFETGPGAQFQFGIELVDQVQISEREPSLGSATYDSPTDDSNVRVNIFADSEDSVLGGRINPGSSNSLQFGLYVTVNDRSSGRRVWQAEIMSNLGNTTRETAGPLMAQILAERLGQPAAQEQVVLE